jgi:hypothetical protein
MRSAENDDFSVPVESESLPTHCSSPHDVRDKAIEEALNGNAGMANALALVYLADQLGVSLR